MITLMSPPHTLAELSSIGKTSGSLLAANNDGGTLAGASDRFVEGWIATSSA